MDLPCIHRVTNMYANHPNSYTSFPISCEMDLTCRWQGTNYSNLGTHDNMDTHITSKHAKLVAPQLSDYSFDFILLQRACAPTKRCVSLCGLRFVLDVDGAAGGIVRLFLVHDLTSEIALHNFPRMLRDVVSYTRFRSARSHRDESKTNIRHHDTTNWEIFGIYIQISTILPRRHASTLRCENNTRARAHAINGATHCRHCENS